MLEGDLDRGNAGDTVGQICVKAGTNLAVRASSSCSWKQAADVGQDKQLVLARASSAGSLLQGSFCQMDSSQQQVVLLVRHRARPIAGTPTTGSPGTDTLSCEGRWLLYTIHLPGVCPLATTMPVVVPHLLGRHRLAALWPGHLADPVWLLVLLGQHVQAALHLDISLMLSSCCCNCQKAACCYHFADPA